ncbi:MAG: cache domain-containing protein, partial [Erysipelothrix sp.]|nr:cache domain-containing protein [Erysipelothrix sp.]
MKIKLRSIKTQITVTLLLVMSAEFLMLGFLSSQRLNELPNIILEQYQEIAFARARELGNEIQGLRNQVEMIALSNVAKSMDLESIQSLLLTMSKQGRFRNFTFSNAQGEAWSTYDQIIDISNQEQFNEIFIKKRASFLSLPFISPFIPEPIPIITVSHAITDEDGTHIGLINGVVSTRFMDELLASIRFQEDGYAWIVDEFGSVVAHPAQDITISDTFMDLTQLDLSTLDDDGDRIFEFVDNGETLINVVSDIPFTNGWKLILSINEVQAFAKANSVSTTINASLVAALVI